MHSPDPAAQAVLDEVRRRVRALLSERNVTSYTASVRSRIGHGVLGKFLDGDTKDLTIGRLAAIAEAFGVDLHALVPAGVPAATPPRGARRKKASRKRTPAAGAATE